MIRTLLVLLLFCSAVASPAQIYLSRGTIFFEKKINVQHRWEDMMKALKGSVDHFSGMPSSFTSRFSLYFDSTKTLYRPGKEVNNIYDLLGELDPDRGNTVYTEFSSGHTVVEKHIGDGSFLLKGDIKPCMWKLYPDTRTIAGFKCHKATAVLFDSVYVIAFFTQDIMTSGGPESFQGLPGMILGVSIPRLHTTWIATRVEANGVSAADLAAPTGGKAMTEEVFRHMMMDSFGFKGELVSYYWQVML